MRKDQTIYFTCPLCEERFVQVEELDRDLHTGETYHCAECGERIVFEAVSFEEYVPPPPARRDCRFCNPDPCRSGPQTQTT